MPAPLSCHVHETLGSLGVPSWSKGRNYGSSPSGGERLSSVDNAWMWNSFRLRRQLTAPVIGDTLRKNADRQCNCMQAAYSASKAGLNAVSEGLRRELKPFGIDVVIIAPGALVCLRLSALNATSSSIAASKMVGDDISESVSMQARSGQRSGETQSAMGSRQRRRAACSVSMCRKRTACLTRRPASLAGSGSPQLWVNVYGRSYSFSSHRQLHQSAAHTYPHGAFLLQVLSKSMHLLS
jgi:hypothetical protein